MRLLTLIEILQKETDEEHPIPAHILCEKLQERGIPSERKTLYRDFTTLSCYGIEIIKTRFPSPGFFLGNRKFELPEIRLLLDAVVTAPFITPKKTAELIEKLCGQLSIYQAEQVKKQIFINQRVKFKNEEIYYTINTINYAISQKKKISFIYYHRTIQNKKIGFKEGKNFLVSPYALLWANDKYYLAGNYEKYDTIGNYRIDRMRHTQITAQTIRPFQEVSIYQDYFDTADYLKKTFNMFSGTPQIIELQCKYDFLETFLDKFGDSVNIVEQTEQTFTVRAKVYSSSGLVEWLMQYGDRVTVISPEDLKQQVVERIQKMRKLYVFSS